MRTTKQRHHEFYVLIIILISLFLMIVVLHGLIGIPLMPDWVPTFTTIFLAIFIEGLPFLILGTLSSGIVEVFISKDRIQKFFNQPSFIAALLGSVMGLAFPVCECGVVPLTRRLYRKGMKIPTGISFLLAAPVINPIVLLSTVAAFGIRKMFFYRIGFTLVIAIIMGVLFSTAEKKEVLIWPDESSTGFITHTDAHQQLHDSEHAHSRRFFSRVLKALGVALDEFFEMGYLLVIGAIVAALMQTLIPQSELMQIGEGPLVSVLVMIALSIILSLCSTVDSFVALGFTNLFSNGSILAFLVFGPMIDLKSVLLFLRVFKTRSVVYLILIPLMLVVLMGVSFNLFFLW